MSLLLDSIFDMKFVFSKLSFGMLGDVHLSRSKDLLMLMNSEIFEVLYSLFDLLFNFNASLINYFAANGSKCSA